MSVNTGLNLNKFKARDLLSFSPDEVGEAVKDLIKNRKKGKNDLMVYVEFDDGEDQLVFFKDLVISRYLWEILLPYHEVKITSKHLITNYYQNGLFNKTSMNKLLSVIYEDIVKTVLKPQNRINEIDGIHKRMFEIINGIYNSYVYKLVPYVVSMDINDLLDVQLEPALLDAIEVVRDKQNVKSINDAYQVLDDLLRSDKFKDNPVAKGYISGMLKANQIKQILGPRGYVTELDDSIFKYPIANSFTLGMPDLYAIAIESRAGAKALFLSNRAISEAEYFARELQEATMVVKRLHRTDCGNTKYMDFYVKEGDIKNMAGKHYLKDADTGEVGVLDGTEKELENSMIQMRAVQHCRHEDKYGVCSACFGDLSYSVSLRGNLGHLCTTTLTEILTQSILSTKHLTASANSNAITMDEIAKKFFYIKDKNGYALKKEFQTAKSGSIKILIPQEACYGIKDIDRVSNIDKVDPGRISTISDMIIEHTGMDGVSTRHHVPVTVENRFGELTLKFIKHIVKTGYELTDDGVYYKFDLSGWKSVTPIMRLPEVEFSFLGLVSDIKSLLKTRKAAGDTPEALLSKLFSKVNSRLDVNIAVLEIIVYAFTGYNKSKNNFDLARCNFDPELLSLKEAIDNRSMGAAYPWNNLPSKILDPKSFIHTDKPDHPMDVFLMPNETVADLYPDRAFS